MSTPLRYVSARRLDGTIEILTATPKGTIREVPLTELEALALISSLAKFLHAEKREGRS